MIFKNQAALLKKARLDSDKSQDDVRKELGLRSPQFISNIERELAGIPFDMVKKLSFIEKKSLIKAMVKDYELSLKEELK